MAYKLFNPCNCLPSMLTQAMQACDIDAKDWDEGCSPDSGAPQDHGQELGAEVQPEGGGQLEVKVQPAGGEQLGADVQPAGRGQLARSAVRHLAGLAHCQDRLGRLQEAEATYRRALQVRGKRGVHGDCEFVGSVTL